MRFNYADDTIERRAISPHWPGRQLRARPIGSLRRIHAPIPAGVGEHLAGIDREAFAAHQARPHRPAQHRLEPMPECAALLESPVAVDRVRRVIGRRILDAQSAEPPIGETELHLLAQPALGADAIRISHDQHPDQQLRVRLGLQAEFFNRIGLKHA